MIVNLTDLSKLLNKTSLFVVSLFYVCPWLILQTLTTSPNPLSCSLPSFWHHRRKQSQKMSILANLLSFTSRLPRAAPVLSPIPPPIQGYHFATTMSKSPFSLAFSSHTKNIPSHPDLDLLFPLSYHSMSFLCFSINFSTRSPLNFPSAQVWLLLSLC